MSGVHAWHREDSLVPPRDGAYEIGMKLYRFRYSPYARKVQILLDLLGARYELVEVPYSDREEIARVTGGYVYVPVLVDGGKVVTESRSICEHLLAGEAGARLVPSPWEGPIWAYADFTDGPLEDILFRIASPAVRDAWKSASDRALYVLIKERKFGAGCVDAWQRDQGALIARAQHLLAPTIRTLASRRFLFGDAPTLADAALYGECQMIKEADPRLLARIDERLIAFLADVDARASRAGDG
jgi:glutathione S-transferase